MRTLYDFDQMCLFVMVYCLIGIIGLMTWCYHIESIKTMKAEAAFSAITYESCPDMETYHGEPDYDALGIQFSCWEI